MGLPKAAYWSRSRGVSACRFILSASVKGPRIFKILTPRLLPPPWLDRTDHDAALASLSGSDAADHFLRRQCQIWHLVGDRDFHGAVGSGPGLSLAGDKEIAGRAAGDHGHGPGLWFADADPGG